MTNSHSSSLRRQRSAMQLDKRKLAIGGEILSAAAQIAVGLLSLESQTKILLFIIFLLSGLAVLVWWSGQSQPEGSPSTRSTSHQLISFLIVGAFTGLAVIAQPTVAARLAAIYAAPKAQPTPSPPAVTAYYVYVHVYRDDGHSGEEEGTDPALPNVVVIVRDQFGSSSIHRTNQKGDVLIPIPHFGEISIGVCRNWQSHDVSQENSSERTASRVKIGLDPEQVTACPS
jgi:hypothetical protein